MSETKKKQRENACEGRFLELRKSLEEAIDLTGYELDSNILNEIHELVRSEAYKADIRDNYYLPTKDDSRPLPDFYNPVSLLPLIPREAEFNSDLIKQYLISINPHIHPTSLEFLSNFRNRDYLKGKFQNDKYKSDFFIKTNFGIGSSDLDKITSDSPFNIELWKRTGRTASGEEIKLEDKDIDNAEKNKDIKIMQENILTVGFWYANINNSNVMLVDQIQTVRADSVVKDIYFKGLDVACDIAKTIKLDEVRVFPAEKHPMFLLHPERWGRIVADLKNIYDANCQRLNFRLDSNGFYYKNLHEDPMVELKNTKLHSN